MKPHVANPERYRALPPTERAAMLGIYAGLLATLTVIEEEIARDPGGVEEVLLETWHQVEMAFVEGQSTLTTAAAIKLLHEYFHHAGDWQAMRACTRQFAEALEMQPQQLSRLVDKGVLAFRLVYQRKYRRAR